jgi:predicted signal transduction protein with EAL and GGDEF domain
MRDTDFVARYGDDEFVVIMPQTTLMGATIFGDRLRKRVANELEASVCCGLAEAQASDDSRTLLTRADSALYSAKAAGPNRQFVHTGSFIREHSALVATGDAGNTVTAGRETTAGAASNEHDSIATDAAAPANVFEVA